MAAPAPAALEILELNAVTIRLIVAEMMPAPEADGLVDGLVEGMRYCHLTTQVAPGGAFWSSHCDLKSVELLRSIPILRSFGFYTGLNHRKKKR